MKISSYLKSGFVVLVGVFLVLNFIAGSNLFADEEGYCCYKGTLSKSTKSDCLEKGGKFFTNYDEAKKYCEAWCWCCIDGKVYHIPAADCKEKGGDCYKTKEDAYKNCGEMCWCCIDGKVYHIPAIDCKKKGGDCYGSKDEAVKNCEGMCWCCIDNTVIYMNGSDCTKKGGRCFGSKEEALKNCEQPPTPVCFCCLPNGMVIKMHPTKCKRRQGQCFPTLAEARKYCERFKVKIYTKVLLMNKWKNGTVTNTAMIVLKKSSQTGAVVTGAIVKVNGQQLAFNNSIQEYMGTVGNLSQGQNVPIHIKLPDSRIISGHVVSSYFVKITYPPPFKMFPVNAPVKVKWQFSDGLTHMGVFKVLKGVNQLFSTTVTALHYTIASLAAISPSIVPGDIIDLRFIADWTSSYSLAGPKAPGSKCSFFTSATVSVKVTKAIRIIKKPIKRLQID